MREPWEPVEWKPHWPWVTAALLVGLLLWSAIILGLTILISSAIPGCARASESVLYFTLPTQGQQRWSEVTAEGDTLPMAECDGGPPVTFFRMLRIFWSPVTGGGGFRLLRERPEPLLPGDTDTIHVSDGAHYYVAATNDSGQACASNLAYVPSDVVTGVPIGPLDPVIETRTFDIHGRLVTGKLGRGVHWQRIRYASGRVVVVVLR